MTDRDFGDAYLRSAWAARFLERMFAKYTVLFVGYSHSDIVMRYLARALGPGAPRFILTAQPDAPDWRELGIHPIGYQLNGDSHEALPDTLERWTQLANMGLLDHRRRLADLTARPPSNVPEEASYLELSIEDPDRVTLFSECARGEEWLDWAATQPTFERLFRPDTRANPCDYALADWFVQHYVLDEAMTSVALQTLRNAGGQISRTLWDVLGQRIHAAGVIGEPRAQWLNPWIVVLVDQAPDNPSHWLEYALVASKLPRDKHLALVLFDRLTEPGVVPVRSLITKVTHFELRFRGSAYWLREAWRELFTPHLSTVATDLLPIAEGHLLRAFLLLSATGSSGPRADPMSWRRSAVEPNSQNQFDEPVDILIDVARDCLEWLLDADPLLGESCLSRWSISDIPILRRLAVHGWAHRSDVDSDEKLRCLRSRGWLFDYDVHHEAFRLVATTIASASTSVADALVQETQVGPAPQADGAYRDYERFNLLAWIARHAPNLVSAQEALAEVKSDHPEFEERPYPDLHSWSSAEFVGPRPPMTIEVLHGQIKTDPAQAIEALRQYEGVKVSIDGPTWHDCIDLLTGTVREHPSDGLALLEHTQSFREILAAIINGWSLSKLEPTMARSILERLAAFDLTEVTHSVSALLADGGRSEATPNEWHRFPESRRVAVALWAAIDGSQPDEPVDNWLERAINHPAGRLALFWVKVVASAWRDAGDAWDRIPPGIKPGLEALLDRSDARTLMAEPVLAQQLYFFYSADKPWCEDHLRPLLRWENPERARRGWEGYLYNPRWNDEILADGLLNDSLDATRNRTLLGAESRRHLWMHLANLTLYSTISPLSWLPVFVTMLESAERVEWIHHVTALLPQLTPAAIEEQWQRWMRQYWQDRLNSVPIELTFEEASAMASWVLRLSASTEEAINLATAHTAGIEEHSNLLHDLKGDPLDRDPTRYARLLAHLLTGTRPPFYSGWYLNEIIPKVRDTADPDDMKTISEQALRLGVDITNL